LNHVRAVKPAAQSRFDYGDVNLLVREILKSHRNGDLEKRRFDLLDQWLNFTSELNHEILLALVTVHLDAFAEVVQVRGRVQACFIARLLQHRRQHVAGRTLAIGARDVDAPEFLMGIAQRLAETEGIGEVFFNGRSTDPAEHGQPGKQVIDGLLVGHSLKLLQNGPELSTGLVFTTISTYFG
jgi:AcrR family transcriptional regulator